MSAASDTLKSMRRSARSAAKLHARSRRLLVDAVRAGAAAGLSQREIAAAIGRSQPEVSRLLRFHGRTPLGRTLEQHRAAVIRAASEAGVSNVRVFGSVARGEDTADSDIDLLVELRDGTTLFALARLEQQLTALLGASVDVVPARSLRQNVRASALADAVPL